MERQQEPSDAPQEALRPLGLHHLLLLIPFIWQVALVPFSNGVALRPLGLPFPMVWQMVGILVTTLVIALVFRIDNRAASAVVEQQQPEGGDQ